MLDRAYVLIKVRRDGQAGIDSRAEDARADPELVLEDTAKMSGVIKAQKKRDFCDAFPAQAGICKIAPAMPQPLPPNPVGNGRALARKQPVNMPDGNIQRRSNFRGA